MMKGTTRTVLMTFMFLSVSLVAWGQENQYKGAYIYQFARIFDWPDKAGSFNIAIYGDSDLEPVLNKIAQTKSVGQQKIVIKKVSSTAGLTDCRIVFVPPGQSSTLAKLKDYAAGKQLLIVSDSKGGTSKGAGINFVNVGGKVLFEINKKNLSGSGMKLPLSLERLAHKVY